MRPIKYFSDYIKTLNNITRYKRITMLLIDEYVKKFLEHKNYKCCVDFYFTRNDELVISYLKNSGDSNTIKYNIGSEQYNDLVGFIDNPELYRNTNKYGL